MEGSENTLLGIVFLIALFGKIPLSIAVAIHQFRQGRRRGRRRY